MRMKSIVAAVLVAGMGSRPCFAADGTHDARVVAAMKKIGGATASWRGWPRVIKPTTSKPKAGARHHFSEPPRRFRSVQGRHGKRVRRF